MPHGGGLVLLSIVASGDFDCRGGYCIVKWQRYRRRCCAIKWQSHQDMLLEDIARGHIAS